MDSTQILPNTLRYGTPPTMPQARSYVHNEPSTEPTFKVTAGTTIQINIPRLQRSYLAKTSELKFRVSLTRKGFNNVCFDTAGAYSLIDSIEVYDYLGSTLLERTEGVAQLVAFLLDTPTPNSPLNSNNTVMLGTQKPMSYRGYFTGNVNPQPYHSWTDGTPCAGLDFQGPYNSINDKYDSSAEFSLPLLSFLGSLSTKLAPLHNGYTVIIKLNSPEQAFGHTDSTLGVPVNSEFAAYVSNVSLKCDILELGPTAETMVLSSVGDGPVIIPTKAIRHYEFANAGTSLSGERRINFPLNINVSSMTALWWFMRPTSNQNNIRYRSLSQRIRNNLTSWAFQYGSSTLPNSGGIQTCIGSIPTPELGVTDAFNVRNAASPTYTELLKSRRISSTEFIDDASWNNNGYDTSLVNSASLRYGELFDVLVPNTEISISFMRVRPPGKFACGLSTDLLPESDNNVVTGLNTNGMSTSISATFDAPSYNMSGTNPSVEDINQIVYLIYVGHQKILGFVLDAYVEYDAFISILPNISTNVSF